MDVSGKAELCNSNEDDLLASSQETIKSNEGSSTSHSAKEPSKISQQQPTKKLNFKQLKSRYQRACFILKKIEVNKQAGVTDPRDKKDEEECKKVVEEYEQHLTTLREENTKPDKSARSVSTKRNRSLEETNNTAKRTKNNKQAGYRPYAEVVKDDFSVALVDEDNRNNKRVSDCWVEIEPRLSEMVMDYLLGNPGGPLPCFDSSVVIRGCRVIRCEDQFSKDFLGKSVAKICDAWEGLKLKLIPAKEIPWRPRARIWLPKMTGLSPDKLLQCLKLHNPNIAMDDWQVIREESHNNNSASYLMLITNESVEALHKVECRLRFGVRHAKLKIFKEAIPAEAADEIDDASSMLEEFNLSEEASVITE